MSLHVDAERIATRYHSFCRRKISHAKLAQTPNSILTTTTRTSPSPAVLHPRSFPTELLLIIFSYVFDDLATFCIDSEHEARKECAVCNSPASTEYQKQKHVVWEWQDDVASHSLFPYALANVCRRWRDIMASVPQFWTRLIVFLDGPALIQGDLQCHLQWSGKLPIEVYVLRRRHSTSLGIDRSERVRSRGVFEAVRPHLQRCHVLRFSLLQSSSLPSLVDDFGGVGGAPLLTDLRLECEVDDQRDHPGGCVSVPVRESLLSPSLHGSVTPARLSCPALTAISLNGRNFRDLSLAIRRGYDFSALQQIEKFTISHYSASLPQSYGFTLSNMLQVIRRERMPRLAFLKLVDLDIQLSDPGTGTAAIPTLIGSVELSALNIHLEELDADVIKHFCTAIELVHDLESFHIIRSPIPDDTWDIPDTCDLMLEEVNDLKGVRSPVKEWIGNRLVFTGCNGFDDEFLRMLRSSGSVLFLPPALCGAVNAASVTGSTATVVPPSSFAFNCPNLQEIYLNDCMNYTIAELKRVIAARNAGLVPRGRRAMESDGPPCILELYVTGIGPELSLEDRQWFEQRLPIFYWETRP